MRDLLHRQLDETEAAREQAHDTVRELGVKLIRYLPDLMAGGADGTIDEAQLAEVLLSIVEGDKERLAMLLEYADEHGALRATLMAVAMASEAALAPQTTAAMRLGFGHAKER